jgi:hypothetical protein
MFHKTGLPKVSVAELDPRSNSFSGSGSRGREDPRRRVEAQQSQLDAGLNFAENLCPGANPMTF